MKYLLVFLLFSILLLAGCNSEPHLKLDGKTILLEIAESTEERQQGLMHRETLCAECGMLFIFQEAGKHGFWMKNTLIPLDLLYFDEDYNVVEMLSLEPCTADPCPISYPEATASYVLEVNPGTFSQNVLGKKARVKR